MNTTNSKEPTMRIDQVPDEELPPITTSQCWCCSEGCGKTDPVLIDHYYFEARDADTGRLLYARKGKVWVSKCCHAEIELWDETAPQGAQRGNFIEWEPLNAEAIDVAAYGYSEAKSGD